MADFTQIDQARKVLGLDDYAAIDEIKEVYHKLSLLYHPDRCVEAKKKECEEVFKKITQAYQTLMTYCLSYRYSFKEDDVRRSIMPKEVYDHLKQFYDGWWGDLEL